MSLSTATPVVFAFARYFGNPTCPRCGEELMAPESSQFAGENCIHHTWSCDSCDHEFHTTIDLGLAAD